MTFFPTHRHAEGGLYECLGPQMGKGDEPGSEWLNGIAYRNEEGMMFWTSEVRWDQRFTPLEVKAESLKIKDDEGTIAYFKFHHFDAGQVRHMLLAAKPQKGHSLSEEFVGWMKRVLECQAEAVSRGLHVRDIDFPDLIGDVNAFHAKFGQEYLGKPRVLPEDLHRFRIKFHEEESTEYNDEYPILLEAIERGDRRDIINSLELQLDALVDLVWVVLGTADLQFGRGAFIAAWRRVVEANMAKVKKEVGVDQGTEDSGREEKYDIVKPAGWVAPDHRDLVQDNAIFDDLFGKKDEPLVETNTYNDGGLGSPSSEIKA